MQSETELSLVQPQQVTLQGIAEPQVDSIN